MEKRFSQEELDESEKWVKNTTPEQRLEHLQKGRAEMEEGLKELFSKKDEK